MLRALVFGCALLAAAGPSSAVTVGQEGMSIGICGGFPGFLCGEKEWCDYPDNTICGDVDQLGMCKPSPETCTKVYIPVCGCDGETYGNASEAAMAGFDVAYVGACRSGL